MADLTVIKEKIHRRILDLRSIKGIIESPTIERLWSESSERLKNELIRFIEAENKEAVKQWVKDHPNIDVGEMGILKLKERARKLGISNYSRMDKRELILNITIKEIDSAEGVS